MYLPGRKRQARLDHLVPHGHKADLQPLFHIQPVMPGGGGDTDIRCGKPGSRPDDGLAGAQILADRPVVGSGDQFRPDLHTASRLVKAAELVHRNTVGAIRHHRAGEDPHRLAIRDRPGKGVARRGAPDHPERLVRRACQTGGIERKPVDGGIVRGWQVRCSDKIRGKHPPGGLCQRHRLDNRVAGNKAGHARHRLLRRQATAIQPGAVAHDAAATSVRPARPQT